MVASSDKLLKYCLLLTNAQAKKIPIPQRDFLTPPRLIIIRSFDVNKPGSEVDELQGGVAGGSLMQGVLQVCTQET